LACNSGDLAAAGVGFCDELLELGTYALRRLGHAAT